MQGMLASLVFSMSVKDETFRAAMATNRREVQKTQQDFDKSGRGMVSAMQDTARDINASALRIVDSFASIGREVRQAGLLLTAGLTAPLGLLAHSANASASTFQAAMNQVHAAMINVSPENLNKLRMAALEMGPAFGKSAIETAGAIEALAKSGMDASAILGGGLESALKLAVVGQAELASSAVATTDIVQQFHMSASQLPGVVDKVTGALDASKLGFDDYRLAIGQVGGIAGGLGYTFDDMNTALAATASYFQSGSDAGTSFKTFLTTLNPASKEAERVMTKLGIITKENGNAFFDAGGGARSLGDIAEVLRTKLGGLSDRSMQDALTTMFGTDAMRTAIALMKEGSAGIADMQKQIEGVTAGQKLEVLLDGEAAAAQRLATSWEKLKIALGNAGIIQIMTGFKSGLALIVELMASAHPPILLVVNAFGALASSIGPLTILLPAMLPVLAGVALRGTLVARGFGLMAASVATLLNPTAFLLRTLGGLIVARVASGAISSLGMAMLRFAGPIGIVVSGLGFLIPLVMKLGQASQYTIDAQAKLNDYQRRGQDIVMQLATATGKAKDEALAHAKALKTEGEQALIAARKHLANARAKYVAQRNFETSGAAVTPMGMIISLFSGRNRTGAAKDLVAANSSVNDIQSQVDSITAGIDAAAKGSAPIDMSFDDPKKVRTKKGRDTSADDEDYAAKLAEVRNAQLQAQADLTGSFEARYRADMDALDADRASYARQLATDQRLTDAKRATLLAEKDKEIETRKAVIEQARTNAKAQEGYDLFAAVNDAEQDLARMASDLTDSAEGRKAAELRLLELQRQREVADLDLILATKATASAEWANAEKRKAALAGIYAQRAEAIGRANEGPAGSYMRFLNRSTSAIGEDVDAGAVDALKGLNTGLTDALMGTAKLADAFENMGKRIIASLLDIAIQQSIIRPLANSLFGVADAAGNRSGGSLAGIGSFFARTFGGGRATGGPIDPSNWYVVGEKGPELFAPGISGTVIPNGGRGNRPSGGGIAQIVPSPYFDVRVDGRVARGATPIAQATTAAGLQQAGRAQSWQGRQTLG